MVRRTTAEQLVGRAEHMLRIETAMATAAAGHGEVLLISGEAGVGKTRLVDELIGRTSDTCFVLVGWCVEHGDQVMPLAAFADVLRAIAESASPAELSELIGPDLAVLRCLVPELDPSAPSHRPDDPLPVARLFSSLLSVLRRASEKRTVVLVLEDMHWADESTRQLVSFLAPRLRDRPVLLTMTYRSDELHRRHPLRPFLVSLQRSVRPEELELAPFTLEELGELVTALTQSAPDARFVESLHERCGGNAFFAEELIARGGRSDQTAMLRDVVLARASGFDATRLMVVRIAAVAGSRVDVSVLAAACGLDPVALAGAVDDIIDAGLWTRDGDHVRFRHELAREVVLGELVPQDRAAAHHAVAEALQAAAPARAGEIAHHWTQTGDQPRALAASVAAGQAAVGIGADSEALLQFERALELWEQVPDAAERAGRVHADLLLDAADAAGRARRFGRAVEHGRRAIDELASGEPRRCGSACLQILEWAWWSEHEDEAGALIDRALALIPADPPSAERALAVSWHARLLLEAGAPLAGDRAEEACRLARGCGDVRAEVRALVTLGAHRSLEGDPSGLDLIREALSLALQDGLPLDASHASFRLIVALDEAGHHSAVVALEPAAVEQCAAAGMQRVFGVMVEFHVIRCLKHLGRWVDAETRVERIREEFGGLAIEHVWLAGTWGSLLVRQGRLHGVRDLIADDLDRGRDHRHVLGAVATTAIELDAAEGRWSAIPTAVDDALDVLLAGHLLPHHVDLAAELVASAVGALADQPRRSTGRALGATVETADRAAAWIARIESSDVADLARTRPLLATRLALAGAELARLRGEPGDGQWRRLVSAWTELSGAYEAAYAKWRLATELLDAGTPRASSERSEAESLLGEAWSSAHEMGAAPLALQIESLARRARLQLAGQPGPTPATGTEPDPVDDLGLTRRELDVLRLVAAGYTNGQIGEALFISRKTASVHVSNILRKLDVSTRIQAGAIATRIGVTTP